MTPRVRELGLAMLARHRQGLTYERIAEEFVVGRCCVWQRIKAARAEEAPTADSPNAKPRLCISRHAKYSPPRTGSASGFIRPIPLGRLTGARA